MFKNRSDAGKQLAKALIHYKTKKIIVLAIPRGGVEVAYHVANKLKAKLSLLIVRKLPLPNNPEAGFGAIAEDGSTYMQEGHELWLSQQNIKRVKREQKKEIKRRIKELRGGKPLPKIKGKTVILVDDGIAMGSTMIAGIKACRNMGAKKIIAASPVSSQEVAAIIKGLVDELVVLEKPRPFYAVAQSYKEWHDVNDEEVKEWLHEP